MTSCVIKSDKQYACKLRTPGMERSTTLYYLLLFLITNEEFNEKSLCQCLVSVGLMGITWTWFKILLVVNIVSSAYSSLKLI